MQPSLSLNKTAQSNPEKQTLEGVLERILFFNEENHYCIGELRLSKTNTTVTVLGSLPGVQCGETLQLTGLWTHHSQHGKQFKIETFHSQLPSTIHGIRKYLGSGLISGIGKIYADNIVEHFGIDTLRIISEEPARLREIPGIGKGRARAIKKAWKEQIEVREIMIFLQAYGVTTRQCINLVKTYGDKVCKIIENNPYIIASEIKGIGFKSADKIAINLGFANDSEPRIDAGILYALDELEDEGHTCYPPNALVSHAAQLLQVNEPLIATRLDFLVQENRLTQLPETGHIQQAPQEYAENTIASCIKGILQEPSTLPPIIIERAIQWAENRMGVSLAPQQITALQTSLANKVSIITGGPGTGKTTILRALVDILRAKKVRVGLAAPTGRAAERMKEATHAHASTIHRLLHFDPTIGRFTVDAKNPLKTKFLIVDEASMLDSKLAAALLRAIPWEAHLLLVGDIHQLPSVGSGNVLSDLIGSNRIPTITLDQIFRQHNRSNIVSTAHFILQGQLTPPTPLLYQLEKVDPHKDLHFIRTETPEDCLALIEELCEKKLPQWYGIDPIMQVQVLSPMHRGAVGILNLNEQLQAHLNPQEISLPLGTTQFRTGDKVIQTKNNYDKNIFNGDLGRIVKVDPREGTVSVNFDGEVIMFKRNELVDLHLAYAISIHKSQGSEFPVVVLPLMRQHMMMLRRNLLYTGITRGRKKVFIVGDPSAYSIAVRNKESQKRVTDLQRKLRKKEE